MKAWEIIWLVMIAFAVISFTYMSIKALVFGVKEMREMVSKLGEKEKE